MKQVDSLGQDMQKIPYAVVLLVDNPTINLTTSRHAMSPAIVSTCQALHTMLNFNTSTGIMDKLNTYYSQVQVDLKTDTPLNLNRTFFNFTCYGEADQSTKLLLMHGQVNRPTGEVCQPIIRMAYNQDDGAFFLLKKNETHFNNTMYDGWLDNGWFMDFQAWPNEILSSFFSSQNLTPTWQDNNYTWGWYDEETERWTGAVGMVSYMICYEVQGGMRI